MTTNDLSKTQGAAVAVLACVLNVAIVAGQPVPMPLWVYVVALLMPLCGTWALFRRDAIRAARAKRIELEENGGRTEVDDAVSNE